MRVMVVACVCNEARQLIVGCVRSVLVEHVSRLLSAAAVRRADGCCGCAASEVDVETARGAGIPVID